MIPKLIAFDLDGTLLTTNKRLTAANMAALLDMADSGAIIALASGRIGSSMMRYADEINIDVAMLTHNGAEVYLSSRDMLSPVRVLTLPQKYSDHLVSYSAGKDYVLNYYGNGKIFTVPNEKTKPWTELYIQQTGSRYVFAENDDYTKYSPSKIIFVGDTIDLDREEKHFKEIWGEKVYIVRTWEHYLEFLHADANKGTGLSILTKALNISMKDVVAFGDSENDIPMLSAVGNGIAVQNASDKVKASASSISQWTNDEDCIAREWEKLKKA